MSMLKHTHKKVIAAGLQWKDKPPQHSLPGLLEWKSPFLSPGILKVSTKQSVQACP